MNYITWLLKKIGRYLKQGINFIKKQLILIILIPTLGLYIAWDIIAVIEFLKVYLLKLGEPKFDLIWIEIILLSNLIWFFGITYLKYREEKQKIKDKVLNTILENKQCLYCSSTDIYRHTTSLYECKACRKYFVEPK